MQTCCIHSYDVQKNYGDGKTRRAYRRLLSLLCFAAVFASVAFILLKTSLVEDVVNFAQRSWYWSCVIFGTAIFLTCFPIPGYGTAALIAGYVMGFWRAAVLTSVASLIGSSCAFWVGRELLRDWIESQVMTRRKLCIIYDAVCAGGFKVVCLIRFAPLPYGLVNMLLSVTSCSFSSFLLATFLDCFHVCFDIFIGSQARCLTDIFKNHRHSTLEQKLSIICSLVFGAAALFGFSAFVVKILRDADLQRALDPPGPDSDSDLDPGDATAAAGGASPAPTSRQSQSAGVDRDVTAGPRRCPTVCGSCHVARDVKGDERSPLARAVTGYGTGDVGGDVTGGGLEEPGGSGRSGSSWIASSFDAASWSINTGARWHLATFRLGFASGRRDVTTPSQPHSHQHQHRSSSHLALPEDGEPTHTLSHRHTTTSMSPPRDPRRAGVDVDVQTDRPGSDVAPRADPAPPSLVGVGVGVGAPEGAEPGSESAPPSGLKRSCSVPDGRLRTFRG